MIESATGEMVETDRSAARKITREPWYGFVAWIDSTRAKWRSSPSACASTPTKTLDRADVVRDGRIPGVGKVTEEKLAKLGAQTVAALRTLDVSLLEQHFGRYGQRLHELALGIDESPVVPDRPAKSISVEDTFERDVLLIETETMIRRLAEKLWSASREETRTPRTVVLKLKTSEFKILTRSHTAGCPPSSSEELTDIALKLRERVNLGPEQRYRLVGVGLSNFREPEEAASQPVLFE